MFCKVSSFIVERNMLDTIGRQFSIASRDRKHGGCMTTGLVSRALMEVSRSPHREQSVERICCSTVISRAPWRNLIRAMLLRRLHAQSLPNSAQRRRKLQMYWERHSQWRQCIRRRQLPEFHYHNTLRKSPCFRVPMWWAQHRHLRCTT